MADTIIAKLQNRRGKRADLPQPLSPGELGLCTDTGQLFIGADPTDISLPSNLIIETFTNIGNTNLAQSVILTQLYQVTVAPAATLPASDIPEDIRIEVLFPDETTPTGKRVYLGYVTPLAVAPTFTAPPTIISEDFVGNLNVFVDGILDLEPSPQNYISADTAAISEIMNFVYYDSLLGQTGIVTVKSNIEITTEFSQQIESGDIIASPVTTMLDPSGVGVIEGYAVNVSDSFDIDYSISIENSYLRVGHLAISAIGYGSGTSQVLDTYSELNNTGLPLVINLTSSVVAGVVNINYEVIPPTPGAIFKSVTTRWMSF